MKIGFIGAGKVGTAFGRYLKEKGLDIAGYSSKSDYSAKRAALFTDSRGLSTHRLVHESDYIFITTPDDVISSVWEQIRNLNIKDKKIFHMSGSLSSNLFKDIEECGAYGYSLHPLYPFSSEAAYKELENAFFTIEGRELSPISDFLNSTGIKYFQIHEDDKAKYHAAAVFASNYIVCLAKIARDILIDCGMPANSETAIYPLLSAAVNNISHSGIESALTGPILRGDSGTVRKHLEALEDFKELYKLLGKVAVDISYKRGTIGENKKDEINHLLGEFE